MSKVIPLKDFGVPVPTALADGTPGIDPTDHLIVYYGPKGFTPSYTQAARIDAGMLSSLSQKTVNGVAYYDDPISTELPGGLGNGDYDFVFTFMNSAGDESDFSAAITATVNTVVPPTPGVPILLG